jgi:hypothetical protein
MDKEMTTRKQTGEKGRKEGDKTHKSDIASGGTNYLAVSPFRLYVPVII